MLQERNCKKNNINTTHCKHQTQHNPTHTYQRSQQEPTQKQPPSSLFRHFNKNPRTKPHQRFHLSMNRKKNHRQISEKEKTFKRGASWKFQRQ